MDTSQEQQLLEKAKEGDRAARESLYLEHAGAVAVQLKSLLGREGPDLEDLLQETFLKGFRSLSTFRGEAALRTWFIRIAHNLFLNLVRRKKPSFPVGEPETPPEENPATLVENEDDRKPLKFKELREVARKVLSPTEFQVLFMASTLSFRASQISPKSFSNREKIALFKSLFRGRDDVYPRLWENPKNGKKGYAPACFNEWVHGVCERPRVKCGECPNQAFIPVGDQVIEGHLKGRHVIGVYPLLKDATCWFLAADFDKAGWREDVTAFRDTARAAGLEPVVERSRSGNGAHVWFFFSAPVAASTARKMGCFLITETMGRRRAVDGVV